MTFAEIRARLAEEQAVLLSDEADVTGGRRVRRFWPGLLEEEIDLGRSFLLKWTSVKNFVNADSAAAATVGDPRANGRVLSGTFRGGDVAKELMEELEQGAPTRFRLVQELFQVADLSATGDGVSDSVEEDAFATTRGEARTGQAAALADELATPQTAGTVVAVENAKDKDGVFRTRKQTRTARAQAAAGASKTISAFDTEATVEGENIVAEPDLPTSQTVGKIVSLRKRLNAFLRWSKVEQTRVATRREWETSYPVFGGTVVVANGRNCTAAEAAAKLAELTAQDPVAVLPVVRMYSLNDYLLYDYTIVKEPGGGRGGGGGEKEIDVEWDDVERVERSFRDPITNVTTSQYALLKYKRGVKQHKSETILKAWLATCGTAGAGGATSFAPLGRWGFRGEYKKFNGVLLAWTAYGDVADLPPEE
jgi:hypothetical protein